MNIHRVLYFPTLKAFSRNIYNGKITLKKDKDQSNLLVEIMNFKSKIKPQNSERKKKKKYILKNLYALFDGRERLIDTLESKIFPIKIEGAGSSDKVSDHSNLKILIPKQMLQR